MFTPPEVIASVNPDVVAVAIPTWLDLTSVIVGSFFGLLCARERQLDLVGFVVMPIVCGLGGGLIRDVIMQAGEVYMLSSPWPILVCVATGLIGFFFPQLLGRHPNLLELVDIFSVGLFVAAGSDKAIVYALNPVAAVLMGTITGVGGGLLRDTILGEVPQIFKKSNYYAICAFVGALVYWCCAWPLHLKKWLCAAACVAATVILRRLSLHYGWYSPTQQG